MFDVERGVLFVPWVACIGEIPTGPPFTDIQAITMDTWGGLRHSNIGKTSQTLCVISFLFNQPKTFPFTDKQHCTVWYNSFNFVYKLNLHSLGIRVYRMAKPTLFYI